MTLDATANPRLARNAANPALSAALAVTAIAAATLAGAWFFQLVLGILPCELCLAQRYAYYLVVPLGVLVAIAAESALAVIGLSSAEQPSLGTMIYWALQHQALLGGRWLWIGSPVGAIVLLFIGLFLTSTGITGHTAIRRGR